MSRIDSAIDTHVFYAFLKFEIRILADEKNKKKVLDFVLQPKRETGENFLAFVILDDEVHFLLNMQQKTETTARKAAYQMLKRLRSFCQELYFDSPKRAKAKTGCRAIDGKDNVLAVCRYIHLLPVERGYVKMAKDYWWSSFQSYRGTYRWEGLDIFTVLRYFTDDAEKSRILLLKYHRIKS